MTPIVELADVSRTYDEGVPVSAVHRVSLVVRPGDYLAILGPSGSGKSTLLSLMGCLDVPTQGTLWVGGKNAAGMSDRQRSRVRSDVVGFVFQQFHLVRHLTARQNVEAALLFRGMSPLERRDRAREMLDKVGLAGRQEHLPSRLSGGEQQRVAVARAIVSSPRLVLADEPTGNLDSVSASQVLDALEQALEPQTALIVVTHNEDVAARSHRRIVLRDGRWSAT